MDVLTEYGSKRLIMGCPGAVVLLFPTVTSDDDEA